MSLLPIDETCPVSQTEPPLPAPSPTAADKVDRDRRRLIEAQRSGRRWPTYVRLSGPGWLQSAITLGGGSLAGALFLGSLAGTTLLWLQLVAIVCGVVMLAAISHVTLSTGRRPFEAINTEINPALGWGWLIATALANMIWAMPQFSLSYDALDQNLWPAMTGNRLGDADQTKWIVTAALLICAGGIVMLNVRRGTAAKLFDAVLKALIGMVVLCFFGVVTLLAIEGQLDFTGIAAGFIPDLDVWHRPAGQLRELVASLPTDKQSYWTGRLVSQQRDVMIASAATAVGINMTFLLPYSMLARGWNRPFRGLAKFDLATGMAIPYVLVTTCVVIAAAMSFHTRVDEALLSDDPAVVRTSGLLMPISEVLYPQGLQSVAPDATEDQVRDAAAARVADVPEAERRIAGSLIKRDAFVLAETLSPLLGQKFSRIIFGLGVLGMGFSTIIILMLINGYAFREMTGRPDDTGPFVVGCLLAGLTGASWVVVWTGGSKFFLAIVASTFGAILLPIAYVTFFLMMNSVNVLGDDKPQGLTAFVWNVLMIAALAASIVSAYAAVRGKMETSPMVGNVILTGLAVYAVLLLVGFAIRRRLPA